MFNLFTCLSANPCRRSSVNMKRETQLPTGLRAPLYLPTTVHSSSHNFRLFHCARSFRKQLSLEALGNLSPSYTVWCWFILVLCHLHLLGPIQCHLGGVWHLATPPQHVRNRTKSPSQKGDPTETLCGTNLVSKKQKKGCGRKQQNLSKIMQHHDISCCVTSTCWSFCRASSFVESQHSPSRHQNQKYDRKLALPGRHFLGSRIRQRLGCHWYQVQTRCNSCLLRRFVIFV